MSRFTFLRCSQAVAMGVALIALAAGPALASDKPKVMTGKTLNTDSLVDALDIGEQAPAKDDMLTRGMKPARPAVNRPSPDAGAGGSASASASGRAGLMVTFKTGSTELTPEGMAMLKKVADALQSDRLIGFSFVVEGHADPRGVQATNLQLSQGRADSVARYLTTQHGVLAERLKPVGKGSSELYDSVRVDAPENRRVTLVTQRP